MSSRKEFVSPRSKGTRTEPYRRRRSEVLSGRLREAPVRTVTSTDSSPGRTGGSLVQLPETSRGLTRRPPTFVPHYPSILHGPLPFPVGRHDTTVGPRDERRYVQETVQPPLSQHSVPYTVKGERTVPVDPYQDQDLSTQGPQGTPPLSPFPIGHVEGTLPVHTRPGPLVLRRGPLVLGLHPSNTRVS